ncbi:MAG: hypothetical protein A2252_12740 [Elusimicrobia bacterium RIFOXYA2_FULL_39_19]|nr:MAG: hypothetical protein A2252_12740 [Elusimicrobia bacterium RIFOXYA2_FULL_39_19]
MEIEKLTQELQKTLGDNLKSIILYGSQASGEATKNNSDYNLLLIIDTTSFSVLKALSKPLEKWLKANNKPPLIFSSESFKNSADVFPIEFLDMKSTHKILYGVSPFDALNISTENLRHECEFELKGKLLKLKQGYLLTRGNSAELKKLLIGSVSTFLVLFKSLLRLTGTPIPIKKLDALKLVAEKTGLNPEPFETVYAMKEGRSGPKDLEALFEKYLNEVEKAADFADRFNAK